MRPFDSDIKNNLDVVLSKLDPAARAISPSHWASFLPDYIIENPALLLCITLAFFIAAVLASILRKIAFVLGLVTALLCVGLFVSRPETAVVIQKQLPLRSGPATTFAEISQLVEGAMVSIEERKDGWVKLAFRRANEKSKEAIGWVEESAITSLSK